MQYAHDKMSPAELEQVVRHKLLQHYEGQLMMARLLADTFVPRHADELHHYNALALEATNQKWAQPDYTFDEVWTVNGRTI